MAWHIQCGGTTDVVIDAIEKNRALANPRTHAMYAKAATHLKDLVALNRNHVNDPQAHAELEASGSDEPGSGQQWIVCTLR
jgi:hypothetical protein